MFKDITTRYPDMSSAGMEVFILLGVSFVLGFLYCYYRSRSHHQGE